MIPATIPHEALYIFDDRAADGRRQHASMLRPVVAWSADGQALVPNHIGRLVPASELAGFREVRARIDKGDVVGVLPGGGWMMHMTDREGGYWEQPVIGWLAFRGGGVRALMPDIDAWPDGAWHELGECGLSHPDQTEVTPQPDTGEHPS